MLKKLLFKRTKVAAKMDGVALGDNPGLEIIIPLSCGPLFRKNKIRTKDWITQNNKSTKIK